MPTINLPRLLKQPKTYNKVLYQHVYQDKQWFILRRMKFATNPICELCAAKQPMVVRVTKVVHHKIPFIVDPTLMYEWSNLISLCVQCHKLEHKKLIKAIGTGV